MDVSAILKTLLPVIGTAVGGPLGGMAVKFFADKLGVPAEKVEDITEWLKGATPDEILKAKTADQEFQFKMAELGFKDKYAIEQLNATDRQSARDREVKTGDNTTRILAGIYTLGYFVLIAIVIFHGIPVESRDIVNSLIGILSAAQLSIMAYYFGSSKGSADKSDAINATLAKSMEKGN
jgi:ABC-type Na+ efflux pump permease subunit